VSGAKNGRCITLNSTEKQAGDVSGVRSVPMTETIYRIWNGPNCIDVTSDVDKADNYTENYRITAYTQ